MTNFSIGLSALRANSQAISVTSNNIANANTDGYHRQDIRFRDRYPVRVGKHLIGTGVAVADIRRLRDEFIETSLTGNVSDQAAVGDQLAVLRRIETLLTPDKGPSMIA